MLVDHCCFNVVVVVVDWLSIYEIHKNGFVVAFSTGACEEQKEND